MNNRPSRLIGEPRVAPMGWLFDAFLKIHTDPDAARERSKGGSLSQFAFVLQQAA